MEKLWRRWSKDSVSQVVPRFRTRVRRWKPWVGKIQKRGFEDTINATGKTGEIKLNIEKESREIKIATL